MEKQQICQSCGMPMKDDRDFGTDENGNKVKDYCHFCYQGGHFTDEGITMGEKIEKLVSIAQDKMNMEEKEARAMASKVIPGLKRWQKLGVKADNKIMIAIFLGTVLMVGVSVLFFSLQDGGTSGSNASDDNFPVATFLPIWVAVFVPIMMANKKKKRNLNDSQKKIMLALLGTTILLVLLTFVLMGR